MLGCLTLLQYMLVYGYKYRLEFFFKRMARYGYKDRLPSLYLDFFAHMAGFCTPLAFAHGWCLRPAKFCS